VTSVRSLVRRRGRRRTALFAFVLAAAVLPMSHGGKAHAFSSCGYAEASTPTTTVIVPLATNCTTCPPGSEIVGPEGVHLGQTGAQVYACETPLI